MSRSYPVRSAAEPKNHKIYDALLGLCGLKNEHFTNLASRKLTSEQIKAGRYATKQHPNSNEAQIDLGRLDSKFDLDDVAGFYKSEEGIRRMAWGTGFYIPVRDIRGHISSLLIRKDDDKKGKYMAFSSNGKNKGAKVWQTTHCPIITGKAHEVAGVEIRITEGILKADVATGLGYHYCLGMHGLNVPKDLENIIKELEVSTLIVSLDAGEDEKPDMIKAKADLIKFADDVGIDIVIEKWDRQYGKGIDDVLKNGYADKIERLTEEEIEQIRLEANEINPNNKEWIYVISIERFVNKNTFDYLKKPQFADKFNIESTHDVNIYLTQGFPKVFGLTFDPNKPLLIKNKDGWKMLNEWRDPNIEPIEGNVDRFIEHIKYLFPDKKEQNILLDWFAFNIQNPGEKIMWALIIIGSQGIGKSFFAHVLKSLVGDHNISCPTNEQINDKYTEWQKRCQIVIIEELMAKDRVDLINKLKPIITQPTTKIRQMYMTPYDYPNRFNIIAFTNHDNALVISKDDRRYCILKSDAKPESKDYYNRLWQWINQERNVQALLYYFLKRDISHFDPFDRAPLTRAKEQMIKISRSALDAWVQDNIEDKAWPFNREMVSIRHLKADNVCPKRLQRYSDYKWAEALKKAGAIQYKASITLSDGSKTRPWLYGDRKNILINEPTKVIAGMYESQKPREGEGSQNPIEENEEF